MMTIWKRSLTSRGMAVGRTNTGVASMRDLELGMLTRLSGLQLRLARGGEHSNGLTWNMSRQGFE
jgi:hypothetical protein